MRRQAAAVRRRNVAAHRYELLQRADLRHDELIEIRRKDAEKAQPGRQRRTGILGELEDARVELEPRQLRVEILLGCQAGWILRLVGQRRNAELAQGDATRAIDGVRRGRVARFRHVTERRA